jgi:RNA polymerase primary sigma factor
LRYCNTFMILRIGSNVKYRTEKSDIQVAKKKKEAKTQTPTGISTRESQSLDRYLQEIGKVSLITPEEEVHLAREIQAGNQEALEKLTKANLRFVVSVAKQYQNQGLSLGDLINEGNLGLIKAAKRFDETRGFKFISYAVWWIRQSILQALAEQSRIVRLPLNRVGALNKIGKELSKLEQEYERIPSAAELAESLEMSITEVADTLRISGRHLSVDAPFAQGEDNRLLDVLENEETPNPDNELMGESLKVEIERALSKLTKREAEVIRLYFGIGREHSLTLEEIGERFDLTRERVRQIKEKALRKLRHHNRSMALRAYLG